MVINRLGGFKGPKSIFYVVDFLVTGTEKLVGI